jgi:hypothetical protein
LTTLETPEETQAGTTSGLFFLIMRSTPKTSFPSRTLRKRDRRITALIGALRFPSLVCDARRGTRISGSRTAKCASKFLHLSHAHYRRGVHHRRPSAPAPVPPTSQQVQSGDGPRSVQATAYLNIRPLACVLFPPDVPTHCPPSLPSTKSGRRAYGYSGWRAIGSAVRCDFISALNLSICLVHPSSGSEAYDDLPCVVAPTMLEVPLEGGVGLRGPAYLVGSGEDVGCFPVPICMLLMSKPHVNYFFKFHPLYWIIRRST